MQLLGSFAGGIGLFLLGMKLMSDGLRTAAGESLRSILRQSTKTLMRGVISGAGITALVQSSSAVTVATIGFVNAGLLNMVQAIGVIYGCNIGTTMTGWLVSLIGLHISIKALAMPLIAVGALLNLMSRHHARASLGLALAGFGLFFLGIDVLKQTFDGMGESIALAELASGGIVGLLQFVGIGILLTFLMQSSSATIAITLTATVAGVIPLAAGAALVIGANMGTTTTALLAVIGATSNARRVAIAHVIFNVLTGVVALLLLPLLLGLLNVLQGFTAAPLDGAIFLALFHTLFNVLGVLLMWPLTPRLAQYLNTLFCNREKKDSALPQYLDSNVLETPALALNAMQLELFRTGSMASASCAACMSAEYSVSQEAVKADYDNLSALMTAMASGAARLSSGELSDSVATYLPLALEAVRYHQEMVETAYDMATVLQHLEQVNHPPLTEELEAFRHRCAHLLQSCDYQGKKLPPAAEYHQHIKELKQSYRALKQHMLRAGVENRLGVQQMVHWLDFLRLAFLLLQQSDRALQALHGFMQYDDASADLSDPVTDHVSTL